MLRIKPFAAVRPPAELAPKVASVPYDVCNREEAVELAKGNDISFLHVVRPDIDLPAETSPYDDSMYDTAKKNFERLIERGALARDDAECIYVYRQSMPLHGRTLTQTGVVCCCHIDDYNEDRIKKHEKTRQDKEDDRTRHVLTLDANAGPVFLMHKDDEPIDALVQRAITAEPLYDFTAPDGITHTVWRVTDTAPFVSAFGALACAYVADGHHRSASAARAGAQHRANNPNHTGEEEYNWFLTVLFQARELNILPYNRVVKDLDGHTAGEFLELLAKAGTLTSDGTKEPAEPYSFCVYLDGAWHTVSLPESSVDASDPINSLDYVLLYERILAPMLGIGDIRKDKRIDFVGGIRGTDGLEKRVDSGEMAVAFSLRPTSIEQLMAVSDAGEIMPPKSTWFEPKLRSGLLVHTLDTE